MWSFFYLLYVFLSAVRFLSYLFDLFLSVFISVYLFFICFYMFLSVSICFYLILSDFICFHLFVFCCYFLPFCISDLESGIRNRSLNWNVDIEWGLVIVRDGHWNEAVFISNCKCAQQCGILWRMRDGELTDTYTGREEHWRCFEQRPAWFSARRTQPTFLYQPRLSRKPPPRPFVCRETRNWLQA